MRHCAIWTACIALLAAWLASPAHGQQKDPARARPNATPAKTGEQPAEADEQAAEDDTPAGGGANAGEKDTRLTMTDIQHMRRQRLSPEQVVDNIAEQGRAFELTPENIVQLRRLGFRPAQIDAVKEAATQPLSPGKWANTDDEERNKTIQEIKQVTAKSGVDVRPVASQHVTLWAASDLQRVYLPDVQKLEKFFHTRCAEPIRSGLDKRTAHVILLRTHAEFAAWCQAMFDLYGEQFDKKDDPGANANFRRRIPQGSVFNWWHFSAISVGEQPLDWAHRDLAANVGRMYFSQLANPSRCGPMETGFANGAEAIVAGCPSVMFSEINYREAARNLGSDRRAWSILVQQRMATNQETPLGKLLQMDTNTMSLPQFAEGWTLVGLLSRQPVKFGKLLLAMRKGSSELEAIEKVYGWDEQQLSQQWRRFVMGQR
jgi:hypothetical protein